MMKRIFRLLFLLTIYFCNTAILQAQAVQNSKAKQKATTKIVSEKKSDTGATPNATGFSINGTVTGFEEGSTVEFLNGQSGATELTTVLKGGKFSFKGNMERPEFKIILFNRQPPFITLFMDNSDINIAGDKATIEKSKIVGSVAHAAFEKFNISLEPYQAVFNENMEYDSAMTVKAMELIREFVANNTSSAITPLAVIRFNQISEDIIKTEELYNLMDPQIKESAMGKYIQQQIAEGKLNGVGSVLADFSQADTSGVMINLSSLRGKYVLIDFWASWCGPCRQENPNLVTAFNNYKNKNFTVLGVSLDKTKQAWLDAIYADGLAWTQVSDLMGWNNSVSQKFQIFSIPQNFLIDPQGKIVGKNLRGPALDKKLSRILR